MLSLYFIASLSGALNLGSGDGNNRLSPLGHHNNLRGSGPRPSSDDGANSSLSPFKSLEDPFVQQTLSDWFRKVGSNLASWVNNSSLKEDHKVTTNDDGDNDNSAPEEGGGTGDIPVGGNPQDRDEELGDPVKSEEEDLMKKKWEEYERKHPAWNCPYELKLFRSGETYALFANVPNSAPPSQEFELQDADLAEMFFNTAVKGAYLEEMNSNPTYLKTCKPFTASFTISLETYLGFEKKKKGH